MTDGEDLSHTFIPAATVVVFRHAADGGPAELLMLERSDGMRFAGGAAVFPGGRIDEADRELAGRIAPHLEREEAAARIAGLRETLEESGLVIACGAGITADDAARARAMLLAEGRLAPVLDRFGWQPDLALLEPWARWCPHWKRSFDTRFYLHDIGTGAVEIAVDQTENTNLFWASAREALAMAGRGEISVIFPTQRNLERLAQFDSFAEASAHAAAIPVETITPSRVMREGQEWLTIPEGLGYPVTGEPLATAVRAQPRS